MKRRQFVAGMGATAALATAAARAPWAVAAGSDPALPITWIPTGLEPVLTAHVIPSDPNSLRGFSTLLYVRDKIGSAAFDDWYLWQWTHDTSRTYLYTAPSIQGPYTARGFGLPPTPYPAGYIENHFSAGDVVWDPVGEQFIASPHGVRDSLEVGNGERCQDSFLTASKDGLNWTWLGGDSRPRLRCGPPRSVDSVHTGYGRLLRDLDGVLTTHAGRYWWIYRGQRDDARFPVGDPSLPPPLNGSLGTSYTPTLASAATIHSDFDRKQKAFDTYSANQLLNSFGSFIRANGCHWVYTVHGKTQMYRTLRDDMAFLPVPIPVGQIISPRGGSIEENNIVRDPTTGKIYNCHVQGIVNADLSVDAETWIYEAGPV